MKRIATSALTKTMVFILLAGFVFLAMRTLVKVASEGEWLEMPFESVAQTDYLRSDTFYRELADQINPIIAHLEDETQAIPAELYDGVYYYAKTADKTVTNQDSGVYDPGFFEKQPFYGQYTLQEGNRPWQLRRVHTTDLAVTLDIAIGAQRLEAAQAHWRQSAAYYTKNLTMCLLWLILGALATCYLCLVAGRKADDALYENAIDKLYTEVLLGGWVLLLALLAFGIAEPLQSYNLRNFYQNEFLMSGLSLAVAALVLLSMIPLLAMMRKIKAGRLAKGSITYVCLRGCWLAVCATYRWLQSFFDGRAYANYPITKGLFIRQMVYLSTSAVFSLFIMALAEYQSDGFILFVLLEGVITAWYVWGNSKSYKQINKGLHESFEEQMKAERSKSILITNVSHDLKTPLTSIISYVDLLSKEEGLSDSARDYVQVLAQKSERLKHIVADLFDLSNSASGTIQLNMERIDLKKLLEQTLADRKDCVEASGLAMRVNLPAQAVMIQSDGKKLYRVFQNVIDNALKYSLEGTRVYIELQTKGNCAVVDIKNTAGYEMDFTANEILQRFSRGDKSRTSEGSGLGLSIAQSFTKACGGDFAVQLDGDLFKVTVQFTLS